MLGGVPEPAGSLRFPAMGTTAHVVVVGGHPVLPNRARARIDQLERRWSRFLADSELSAINAADGMPVVVSDDTALLVERSLDAWAATGGAFDPTVHDAVVGLGYDTHIAGRTPAVVPEPGPAPGLGGARVDRATGLVWLPAGVHLDPGGLGKGLAADLVVADLLEAGADGACVNLGGDLYVAGRAPEGDAWTIAVDDPFDRSRELRRVGLAAGGLATSSRLDRSWGDAHHLVDPATGRPIRSGIAAVTAIAATAAEAEVATKAAFLRGPEAALAEAPPGVELLVVSDDGTVRSTALLEAVAA